MGHGPFHLESLTLPAVCRMDYELIKEPSMSDSRLGTVLGGYELLTGRPLLPSRGNLDPLSNPSR
jgi:hypothetical protein